MAIESCIRTIVGSAVNRPPKSLIGRIGDKKVKVSRGKVSGKSSSRIKRAISEAAIICNLQLGEFSVPYLSEEITFRPEDNISTRVFSAINTKVVEDLANKLKLLKPYPFFLLEGKGSIQWNDWAGDRAINILHAFNLRGFVIRDDQAWDFQNSDGSLPYRTTNMLNLSNDLNKEINDLFVIESQNGGKFNSLELLLNRETTPPMVCEPSNRTCDDNKSSMFELDLYNQLKDIGIVLQNSEDLSNDSGGFKTPHMRARYPLISNNSIEDSLNIVRLEPSPEAVLALDYLQKTEWKIDERVKQIAVEVLKEFVQEKLVDSFEIRKVKPTSKTSKSMFLKDFRKNAVANNDTEDIDWNAVNELATSWWDEHACDEEKEWWKQKATEYNNTEILCLDMEQFPCLTLGQASMWNASLEFIELLEAKFPDQTNRKFWHAWSFDWRGRMVTCSTILSPQNDDFARGLLRFGNSEKLNEEGWLWLQRHTAAIMRGRNLPDGANWTDQEHEAWEEIQKLLSLRTHSNQDAVANNPAFYQILKKISEDPRSNKSIWADGDVFKAKSEGFQRISAIITYVDAFDQGGLGANVCLPISHDASSSIYQQAAMLVRDKEMAQLVNVIEGDELPADVYQTVIDDLKKQWSKINPFPKQLTKEQIIGIKNSVLNRNTSKKPVMTIAYGATERNMMYSLLSHNGNNTGLLGDWIPIKREPQDSFTLVDDISTIPREEWAWRMVAHPSSILWGSLQEIDESYHEEIARVIISDMLESVKRVLPGFKTMIDTLHEIIEMMEENQHVSWELADGTIVRNVKLMKSKSQSRESPEYFDGSAIRIRKIALDSLQIEKHTSIPLDMRKPIVWIDLPEKLDSKLREILWNEELKRVSDFEIALKELEFSPKQLFIFETRKIIKADLPANAKISELLEQKWQNLEQNEQNVLNERIEILKGECIGRSIDEKGDTRDWFLNWSNFRLATGLLKGDEAPNTNEIKALHPSVRRILRRFIGKAPCTFSRRQITDESNPKGEKAGIAPNFVHSHDACHMRLVVKDLWLQGVRNIWSVHDAFGCHPNFISLMRDSVKDNLILTHNDDESGRGTLDRLMKKHLKTGIEDLLKQSQGTELKLEDVGSEYLVY